VVNKKIAFLRFSRVFAVNKTDFFLQTIQVNPVNPDFQRNCRLTGMGNSANEFYLESQTIQTLTDKFGFSHTKSFAEFAQAGHSLRKQVSWKRNFEINHSRLK
jgi:hypothetical protein